MSISIEHSNLILRLSSDGFLVFELKQPIGSSVCSIEKECLLVRVISYTDLRAPDYPHMMDFQTDMESFMGTFTPKTITNFKSYDNKCLFCQPDFLQCDIATRSRFVKFCVKSQLTLDVECQILAPRGMGSMGVEGSCLEQ